MNLSTLTRKSPRKHHREIGRGGKRGKTAGRGHKGQKARAGRRMRPELRDLIKKLPKKRGYGKNRAVAVVPRTPLAALNLSTLNESKVTTVTRESLVEAKLVSKTAIKSGVKILGTGDISRKIEVGPGIKVSASAKEKIVAAGGSVA